LIGCRILKRWASEWDLNMQMFVNAVDQLNSWIGKLFAWCIVLLTGVICYEVFVRYLLGSPTDWAFDASYILYGTLFMMAGAYTLARNGHVRGDFIYSGWGFAKLSWLLNERSPFSPNGPIMWPFKMLIPVTGVLMLLQGIVECIRCIQCLQTGKWPQRINDVEEMEKLILERAAADKAKAGA
jgi:TRAP-type mannitol/chloroaromatic compound transport system permease small subunit